ncbi:hypothetical protein BH18GEM1_BH18GEM1_11050 [soil metagenome]
MLRNALAPAILIAATLIPGCADDGPVSPFPPDPMAAEIRDLIEDLFAGDAEEEALNRFDVIEDEIEGGQGQQAIEDALALIGFVQINLGSGDLEDPPGAATAETASAALAEALLEFVGFANVTVPPEALAPGGAVGVLDQSGGNVTTANGHAGLSLPPGSLSGQTVFILRNIPEEGDPGDHAGPLTTTLDQYPLFYDIVTSPPVGRLAVPGLVGLCVVDPPDPFAPDPVIAGRLQLAHPDPDEPARIEILPRAEVPFLDCAGASTQTGLTLAGPGKLGGAISSFSPFAAVDPESGGSAP